MHVIFKRRDGTYVVEIGGYQFHVTPEYPDMFEQAKVDGVNAPFDPEPEPPIYTAPESISRFQARAALLAAGRLADVEAAVAAADAFSQLAWAEAQEWRRDSPTLDALAKGIGLTDAEIDDLFIQAAAIRA